MINKLNASKFDECYTPATAVLPLVRHLPGWVKRVWCPCDKPESEIAKGLANAGYKVYHSHIDDGYDFLSFKKDLPGLSMIDMIITNPPYSNKDKFVEQCVNLGRPWALLLPTDALCGDKRNKFYSVAGVGVITLANRLDFTGKGANWFYNAWVCSWPEINGKWIREDIKCVKNKRK